MTPGRPRFPECNGKINVNTKTQAHTRDSIACGYPLSSSHKLDHIFRRQGHGENKPKLNEKCWPWLGFLWRALQLQQHRKPQKLVMATKAQTFATPTSYSCIHSWLSWVAGKKAGYEAGEVCQ